MNRANQANKIIVWRTRSDRVLAAAAAAAAAARSNGIDTGRDKWRVNTGQRQPARVGGAPARSGTLTQTERPVGLALARSAGRGQTRRRTRVPSARAPPLPARSLLHIGILSSDIELARRLSAFGWRRSRRLIWRRNQLESGEQLPKLDRAMRAERKRSSCLRSETAPNVTAHSNYILISISRFLAELARR